MTNLATIGGRRRAIDALRDQIAPDANDEELLYLAQVADRYGLDAIAGQIVLIPRYDSRLRRQVRRPQITADGRLALAERTGELDGFVGPEWCGPRNQNGTHDWLDMWDDDTPPHAARVFVYRKGRTHPANGTVRWAEFAQKDNQGNLLPTWRQMPAHMLGKVALNLGLRRAFPGVVPGDLDIADDLAPWDHQTEPPAPPPPRPPVAGGQTLTRDEIERRRQAAISRGGKTSGPADSYPSTSSDDAAGPDPVPEAVHDDSPEARGLDPSLDRPKYDPADNDPGRPY